MTGPFADFLSDPNWDSPFFKKLPKNDSGDRESNQAGFVIVRSLEAFFPVLAEDEADAEHPTVERWLHAELYIGLEPIGTSSVRYQIQTWGGTRHEARVTDGTQALLTDSHTDDFVVVQRSRHHLNRYRFFLIRQTGPHYAAVEKQVAGRRWGSLDENATPLVQSEFVEARTAILADIANPFSASVPPERRVVGERIALARSVAFRQTVVSQYRGYCAVSGISIRTPDDFLEVQAAHIVPLSQGGPDDPRNGVSLTGTLHWAFDRGLFAIGADRRVIVPSAVSAIDENRWLVDYSGTELRETVRAEYAPADEAFAWHRDHVFAKWS